MRNEGRGNLLAALRLLTPDFHFVFCSRFLPECYERRWGITLSTTERHLAKTTEFDKLLRHGVIEDGQTLHYVDHEDKTLMTYRRLWSRRGTADHDGLFYVSPIADASVKRKNGELFHSAERQDFDALRLQWDKLR